MKNERRTPCLIRIHHECEGRIDKSVPEIRGLPRDAKRGSRGTDFSIVTSHSDLKSQRMSNLLKQVVRPKPYSAK